jgi:hypothetical protein
MARIKLFLVAILTIVAIGLGGFVFTQQAETQQTGGLNLNVHCQRHHGSNARAVNIDGTAYGWRCEVNGVRHTMNMDSACVFLLVLGNFSSTCSTIICPAFTFANISVFTSPKILSIFTPFHSTAILQSLYIIRGAGHVLNIVGSITELQAKRCNL